MHPESVLLPVECEMATIPSLGDFTSKTESWYVPGGAPETPGVRIEPARWNGKQ
jgi:hypothetical protein